MDPCPSTDAAANVEPTRRRVVSLAGGHPVAALLAIDIGPDGRTTLRPAEFHYNPLGTVHGGVIATVLDLAMASAVDAAISPGRSATRLEIKVNYLRGVTGAAGEVFGEAVLVQAGRRIAAATARLTDGGGRVYATASATFLVSDRPPAVNLAAPAGVREFAWSEPLALAKAGATMAGLEFLRAMASGALPPPPVLQTLGIVMASVASGRVAMNLAPGEHLHDANGCVHGGMVATLLDSVMGCAVNSTMPLGRGYTTVELGVRFIRPITPATGVIAGVGTVVHSGHQVATAEARATGPEGAVYAIASTTCLVFDIRPPA